MVRAWDMSRAAVMGETLISMATSSGASSLGAAVVVVLSGEQIRASAARSSIISAWIQPRSMALLW